MYSIRCSKVQYILVGNVAESEYSCAGPPSFILSIWKIYNELPFKSLIVALFVLFTNISLELVSEGGFQVIK